MYMYRCISSIGGPGGSLNLKFAVGRTADANLTSLV